MDIESTIRAYQQTLSKWRFQNVPTSFSERFAQERFLKKMEKPDAQKVDALAEECFNTFLTQDSHLPTTIHLPPGEWYRARNLIHDMVKVGRRRHRVKLPTGSSVITTRGTNSVEAWLCNNSWTCTVDCFDDFVELVYGHKALKRAARRRYTKWYSAMSFDLDMRQSDRYLFRKLGCGKKIFRWKMSRIVKIVRGSRFSTVPKNNLKRRPINLEPLGNMLVQSCLGEELREGLRAFFGVDLDNLQAVHRDRVSDLRDATIDLSNASDSVSLALVEFLFPKSFVQRLMKARSYLIYGLDDDYHATKKISSMGNGFTFELMTTILTAICRVLDPHASVFGDDIIINTQKADRLIDLLQGVGFSVNRDKSFTEGPFRESCGANYHETEGYIKSFDFWYPTNIADCAMALNKATILARSYKSFAVLRDILLRQTPKALRGGPLTFELEDALQPSKGKQEVIPLYFACNESGLRNRRTDALAADWQLKRESLGVFPGFKFVQAERTRTLKDLRPNWHWAKYEMFLASGRVTVDGITGNGRWELCQFLRIDNTTSCGVPRRTPTRS